MLRPRPIVRCNAVRSRPANDVRRTVRLISGGESHHPNGARGNVVRTLCGRELVGAHIWSSNTEASCADCTRIAADAAKETP